MISLNYSHSIKDQVYEIVKHRIMTMQFKPGQALSEKELSENLQVSRTPVREAFIQLASDKLVKIYPQRGTLVSKISLASIYESGFIREALEVAVIHKLIEGIDNQGIRDLENLVEEQDHCRKSNNNEKFYKLDEAFHQKLSELSQYPATWEVLKSVKLQMDRARYLSLKAESRMQKIIDQHQLIVKAIIAKDPILGERHIRDHIRGTLLNIDELSLEFSAFFEK